MKRDTTRLRKLENAVREFATIGFYFHPCDADRTGTRPQEETVSLIPSQWRDCRYEREFRQVLGLQPERLRILIRVGVLLRLG